MWHRGWDTHVAKEKGCLSYCLLFGNWEDYANVRAHKSNEGNVGVEGVNDIVDICFGSASVVRV